MRSGKTAHRDLQETELNWILPSPEVEFTMHSMKKNSGGVGNI